MALNQACLGKIYPSISTEVTLDALQKYARASIELLEDDADAEIPARCALCVRLLERVIEQRGALFEPPHRLDSSAWVSSRLAEILPLPLAVKQTLLEIADGRARLERLNGLLSTEPARDDT